MTPTPTTMTEADGWKIDPKAIEALRDHQQQLDADGVMVGVSREALEMLLAAYAAASAEPCRFCKGTGTEPDWIGDDMRCVEVACTACSGTGRAKSEAEPALTPDEKRAQAARCSCHGSDDYCPCQNVADRQTRLQRKMADSTS